ncbi:MAG: HAD family phosphatase [Peptococcaceae bacterium]|jgi:HAD superfamily hydrolase (TIGR01509 family)|nr:HAD family phosphatase [Peptococcaceae bacterium]
MDEVWKEKRRRPVRAVLWDLDGVLIDSEPGYFVAIGEMMRSLGYPYGEKEAAKIKGSSYKNIAEMLALDEPPEEIQRLYIDVLMGSVRDNVSGLIDGVTDFLDRMRAMGIKMAIGSSSPRRLVDYVVEKFGLGTWMSVMVTGCDKEHGKPAPDIYLECAKLLEVNPEGCLVIEDSTNGILSGKRAGMRVCAFTGTRTKEFDLSDADLAIHEYSWETFQKVARIM